MPATVDRQPARCSSTQGPTIAGRRPTGSPPASAATRWCGPEKLRGRARRRTAPAGAGRPGVEGVVESSLYLGTATQIAVDLGEDVRMTVLVPNADEAERQRLPGGGARVALSWEPEHMHLVRESPSGGTGARTTAPAPPTSRSWKRPERMSQMAARRTSAVSPDRAGRPGRGGAGPRARRLRRRRRRDRRRRRHRSRDSEARRQADRAT